MLLVELLNLEKENLMIDYQKIADAIKYYEKLGYKYIDVPWFVSLDNFLITRPQGARIFETFAGTLIASGEQSFLEIRTQLKPGKYQCVTPCFRDEKIKDDLHLQYFIKNELIIIPENTWNRHLEKDLEKMVNDAKDFFVKYSPNNLTFHFMCDKQYTDICIPIDLLINNIEVGSYGCRVWDGFCWIYGTGCAEPRLTQAIESKHG